MNRMLKTFFTFGRTQYLGLSHVQEERASIVTYSIIQYNAMGLHPVLNTATFIHSMYY